MPSETPGGGWGGGSRTLSSTEQHCWSKGSKRKLKQRRLLIYFFFTRDFLICIFRPKVVGVAWAELIPLPLLVPSCWGGEGVGMAWLLLGLYSYSVRANCTRTCNIQAGLKVCGTNTHSLVFFSGFVFLRIVSLICLVFYFTNKK